MTTELLAAGIARCSRTPAYIISTMGSYTSLSVDGYEIHSSKSYVDLEVMTIFRESDKEYRVVDEHDVTVMQSRTIIQPNRANDEGLQVRYRASAGAIRDRLDVMGFTRERAHAEFEAGSRAQ